MSEQGRALLAMLEKEAASGFVKTVINIGSGTFATEYESAAIKLLETNGFAYEFSDREYGGEVVRILTVTR